ncbi:MAG: alpha/beta fold hydrolase [Parvularculaceae bacterium]
MTAADDGLAPRRMRVAIPGGEVALLRFGGPGAAPLLFAHANGFCASAYRQMFEALGARFDIFAADLRGHGRTHLPAHPQGHRSMAIFGDDLRQTKRALGDVVGRGARWIVAGHSLGGVAATLAAASDENVAALRIIEPVAMPRSWSAIAATPVWPAIARRLPLVKGAMRRRRAWPSRDAALASYAAKGFFAKWAPGVLEDYLADGLVIDETGACLSCAPEWEAANFAAQANAFWDGLATVRAPVSVLAAAHPSTTLRGDAKSRFRKLGARVETATGVTHLVPFEDPRRAAGFLAGFPV